MSLPLTNGLEVVGSTLNTVDGFGWGFVFAGSLELTGQSRGGGVAAADEAMATGLCIVDLDELLLGRGLAVEHVALLAGVGTLAFCSCVGDAYGRVCGILQAGQGDATGRHGGLRGRGGNGCHTGAAGSGGGCAVGVWVVLEVVGGGELELGRSRRDVRGHTSRFSAARCSHGSGGWRISRGRGSERRRVDQQPTSEGWAGEGVLCCGGWSSVNKRSACA